MLGWRKSEEKASVWEKTGVIGRHGGQISVASNTTSTTFENTNRLSINRIDYTKYPIERDTLSCKTVNHLNDLLNYIFQINQLTCLPLT